MKKNERIRCRYVNDLLNSVKKYIFQWDMFKKNGREFEMEMDERKKIEIS